MPPPADLNPTLVSEEHSQRELASTAVAKPLARRFAIAFAMLLGLPFVAQFVWQFGQERTAEEARKMEWPPTRKSLEALSGRLDETSVFKQWVQPKLQELLTGVGGFGNEKVTIGKAGWLYYTPGLRYIFGHPFLDDRYLRAKAKAMIDKDGLGTANPNPLPAFRQLAEDCRRLGIHLILAPIPDKGMVTPEHLSTGAERGTLQNPDYGRFRTTMESLGVTVYDAEINPADAPWFLRQDTHWTPQFMERTAAGLAELLRTKVAGGSKAMYRLAAREVSNRGDLVAMLKLPPDQTLFGAETVRINEVSAAEPLPEPEVILLGDSFTNIYSSPSLKWGERAGLGEHLAVRLNAPVDTIAMNGGGASIRQELLRAARGGRLGRTRAIVYQFAIRDLYLEDWPVIALGEVERKPPAAAEKAPAPPPVPEKKEAEPAVIPDSTELTISGTISMISRPIDPSAAPYEDALLYGKVRVSKVETGAYSKPELIVVFLAMQKRTLLPGANQQVGKAVRLRLVRLKNAPAEIRSLQRSDDTNDYELIPYYVVAELE